MISSSIAQNSKDVTIKWGPPVSHFFDSEEVKALSFDGAFYNLHESSFPLYQEKIRLPQNVSQVEVNVDVLENSTTGTVLSINLFKVCLGSSTKKSFIAFLAF